MDYFVNLPVVPFIIISALIGVLGTLYIYRLKACRHFRRVVETELKGVWPTTYLSPDEVNVKIRQSRKEIETASLEVKRFVSFHRKRAFNTAVENYCNACKTINWNGHVAYEMFPSMRKSGDIDPKQYFFNCIEEMLKFTK